ncbi:hypothetical protein [Pseudolysinimonas sp.]|jgi:hypothetical protein|uniref:hypothetical protein n=1 Tax=Pseudolysinimonas sp. TaxID=2680009 RepID=UPI003784BA39
MRLTTPAALLTAGLLTLTLAGCFANPLEELTESGIEGIVEEATGVDVDVDSDGSASIPDGFPADVPIPPGLPVTSLAVDNIFQLTYAIDDAAVAEAVVAELVAGGYTEIATSDLGELKTWIYENDRYNVALSLLTDGETIQLVESVTIKE